MLFLEKMSLNLSDLKKVYTATYEARNKWRNILLTLEVSSDTIESIGTKYMNKAEDCYRDGLSKWLDVKARTWGDLTEALSSPIVGHNKIAMEIEEAYIQPVGSANSSASRQQNVAVTPIRDQKISDDLTIFSDKRVGAGAFGVVFKGDYKGRPCAAKVLHSVATQMLTSLPAVQEGTAETNVLFNRECEFLKSFKHCNIVQHFSTEKHPMSGSTILVTELMDCNLRAYLQKLGEESLSILCQISLSKDVASGLAYIHERQIIHRDLCGDNILLTLNQPVPVAKITDFGMSRLLDPSQMSHTLTAVAHRMGYLPSEALRLENEEYDYSLDVFSLGVIIVQIVQKQETVKTTKDRSLYVSQIPTTHKLKNVISNCLHEEMKKRPPAKDICSMLEGKLEFNEEDGNRKRLELPLTLNWQKGQNMPNKMTRVQSVVTNDAMYVGGGYAKTTSEELTVMKFDLQHEVWIRLPKYKARWFAMTSIANHLVLVGGRDPKTKEVSKQVAKFEQALWTNPYLPMNIARDSSTAIQYQCSYIIVAGGCGNQGCLSTVEVLDAVLTQWYIVQSLPKPQAELKPTLISNTLYFIGGYDDAGLPIKVMYKVNLNELLKSPKNSSTDSHWLTLETPLGLPAPLSFNHSLFTVGGWDAHGDPSSCIYLYQTNTSWVKLGDLSFARSDCTCSVLPNGKIIVAGGETGLWNWIDDVDFLSIL